MVGIGNGLFIELPSNSNKRILHPARVVGHTEGAYTADVAEHDLPVECDQEVIIYYERKREFLKQSARIHDVDRIATTPTDASTAPDVAARDIDEAGPQLLVSFTTTGDPVSAESRQNYRVSTAISEMTAGVGPEDTCRVLDVSSTGFSAIASERYEIGHVVEASFDHAGRSFSGNVCIQSVRELEEGQTRYGMHCVDDKGSRGDLAKGLQQISMHVQREQLRRLAGSA